jgi:hypothetical protein
MRRFEIQEIANGWILTYYSDYGQHQRFFNTLDDLYLVLSAVTETKDPKILTNRAI